MQTLTGFAGTYENLEDQALKELGLKEEKPPEPRPTWHQYCWNGFKHYTSKKFVCTECKEGHDHTQKLMREMFVAKASAVIVGFVIQNACQLTVLHILNLMGFDTVGKGDAKKAGDLKITNPEHAEGPLWPYIFTNGIVFAALLALSSAIATCISPHRDDSDDEDDKKDKKKKGESKALSDDESDDDSADDNISVLDRERSASKKALSESFAHMRASYVAGAHLIPAWAWKSFVVAVSVAVTNLIRGTGGGGDGNTTNVTIATNATEGNETMDCHSTTPSPSQGIIDPETAYNMMLAIAILFISASLQLCLKHVAHVVSACTCVFSALDSWATCMALAAGWAVNRAISKTLKSFLSVGSALAAQIVFTLVLTVFMHCLQQRIRDFLERYKKPERPRLPMLCKGVLNLTALSMGFVIGWAWKAMITTLLTLAKITLGYQAIIVTAMGILILLVWPWCCKGAGYGQVVHLAIGMNIGWFWMDWTNMFLINLTGENGSLGMFWLATMGIMLGIFLMGLLLEFMLACGARAANAVCVIPDDASSDEDGFD